MASESREIFPFEFLGENDEGDFRPIDREIIDPKDESAPASAPSLESIPTPELVPSATASTETTQHKEEESSSQTLPLLTSPGKSEQPAAGELPTLPQIPTPGSQNEGKRTSQTKQS